MKTTQCHFYLSISLLVSSFTNILSAKPVIDDSTFASVKKQVSAIHWHSLSDLGDWGYTVETLLVNGSGKKQQRIQSYDPAKPTESQWQLIQQQYEKPSKAILQEYVSNQQSIADDEASVEIDNIEIVDKSTLRLISEEKDYYVFSFRPHLPMFERDVNENFDGHLYFNKQTKWVEKLHLKARESFSIGMSMSIESYEMNILIKLIEGELHLSSMNSDKSGTILFFTDFNERSTRNFSDFHRIAH